jgi:hypothetical protein
MYFGKCVVVKTKEHVVAGGIPGYARYLTSSQWVCGSKFVAKLPLEEHGVA